MNAKWIAPPKIRYDKNLYFRARSIFDLKEALPEAKIKISAESFYKVWVNGHLVGAGPARGSRRLNFYETLEIGSFLQAGRNVVGVLVHCANAKSNLSYSAFGGALLAEIEGVTWTGDRQWTVRNACDEWLPLEGSSFVCNVGFSEYRDFNREPEGWLAGAGQDGWIEPEILGAAESAIPGKELLPRPVPMQTIATFLPQQIAHLAETRPMAGFEEEKVDVLMASEPHYPASPELTARLTRLTLADAGEAIIDPPGQRRGVAITFGFGRETIGFFEAEIIAPESGIVVDVAYDEELKENGRMVEAYRIADRYILKKGLNRVGTSLLERGFRFVEISIRNFKLPVTIRAVRAVDRRYPVSRRGSFFSSDLALNRVWEISVETLSVCATDIFNDCPWRERAFWVNDLIVENLTWLQAFGDSRLNAHALRLALSNIREDGWMPGVNPDFDDPRMVLVPTNLYLPLMLRDYLNHSGDLELVRELLPKALELQRLFDNLVNEEGLARAPEKYWNFLDWSYELRDENLDGRTTSLVEWVRCMSLMEAASLLVECGGDAAQAQALRRKARALSKAILKRLWPEGAKHCSDWLEKDGTPSRNSSQLTHALALLSGTLPEEKKKEALLRLEDDSIRITELYLHHFIFQALEANGMTHSALDRVRRYWGDMVLTGTPTLWENYIHQRGKAAMKNTGSLCHGFGASPIGVLQRGILGVRPLRPGFREFSFAPKSCGLAFAWGSVPTPGGDIGVKWSAENGELNATLTVPDGLTARLADGSKLGAGKHQLTLQEKTDEESPESSPSLEEALELI